MKKWKEREKDGAYKRSNIDIGLHVKYSNIGDQNGCVNPASASHTHSSFLFATSYLESCYNRIFEYICSKGCPQIQQDNNNNKDKVAYLKKGYEKRYL